jgi:prolyl-tRNA synthetase
MRGREFLMKDAYSFDRDDAGAEASYRAMHEAYSRIFRGMALDFRIVEADSGAIGGKFSHEFMVMADTGEDAVAACADWPRCSWAANVERAPVPAREAAERLPCPPRVEISTPARHTVNDVCAFLNLPPRALIKTLLFEADGLPVAALVRGDRELNEVKFKSLLEAETLEFATPDQVLAWTGAPAGFAGPLGLADHVRLYADHELGTGNDWVAGANKKDVHVRHLDLERDVNRPIVTADLRNAEAGDPCPACGRPLEIKRGIEVGHIFKLGTKYSLPMRAFFLDENGREQPMVMGCYGIGVSRVVAACIEQNHDRDGILFPPPLAPFDAHLISLDPRDPEVGARADEIAAFLEKQGLDILYDDREERPGVKFKDADLLGLPARIVVGGKGLAQGTVEGKNRRTGETVSLPADGFHEEFPAFYRGVLQSWER